MSELQVGMAIADRLNQLEHRAADLERRLLEHELAPGAHAAAFEAHDMSPGVVEDAEEAAQEILENAQDVAEESVAAVTAAGEDAVEVIAEAAEAAVDAPADAVEEVAGEESTEESGGEGEKPEGEGERAPARVHPMHKQLWKR